MLKGRKGIETMCMLQNRNFVQSIRVLNKTHRIEQIKNR